MCHKSSDSAASDKVIEDLRRQSANRIAALREEEHSENWKEKVEQRLQEVDFVLFLLGQNSFASSALRWEFAKARQLDKHIVGIKLRDASEESILFCQSLLVFDNPTQCWSYLEEAFEEDRKLLLEQYKIMVCSTEKVTEQRLRVNNLLLTVTSSLLSVSVVFGKAFEFSIFGLLGMVVLTAMAYLTTHFWEKCVRSYGKLNTGKFLVIDQIEKRLGTNMFEFEWDTLRKRTHYESNTHTETVFVRRFRSFILVVGLAEIVGMLSKLVLCV